MIMSIEENKYKQKNRKAKRSLPTENTQKPDTSRAKDGPPPNKRRRLNSTPGSTRSGCGSTPISHTSNTKSKNKHKSKSTRRSKNKTRNTPKSNCNDEEESHGFGEDDYERPFGVWVYQDDDEVKWYVEIHGVNMQFADQESFNVTHNTLCLRGKMGGYDPANGKVIRVCFILSVSCILSVLVPYFLFVNYCS